MSKSLYQEKLQLQLGVKAFLVVRCEFGSADNMSVGLRS